MIYVALVILIFCLTIGVPVPVSFMSSCAWLIFFGGANGAGYPATQLLPYGFTQMNSVSLIAIAMFILAGGIMERGRIAEKLIDMVDVFVGHIRGGLGIVAVISCAVFGSICGAACATLSCIGAIMFPRLKQGGYPMGHACALMANASLLGLLIPPNATLIIFAWISGISVLSCFLSTVGPGFVTIALLSAINVWMLRNNKEVFVEVKRTGKERMDMFMKRGRLAIPALVMPFMVLGGIYGGVMTTILEPEAVPLNIKIVLLGDPTLYYTLAETDPDFPELFKVEANFYPQMDKTPENIAKYARLIASQARKNHLRPLHKSAVARVIEQASRLADDSQKLTAHISSINDLIREANYCAFAAKSDIIERSHVDQAITAKIKRSDRVQERMTEQIRRGTVLIDTEGEVVGQINGLAVYEFGQVSFGRPNRITCLARMGRGDIIDIEREVDLGGPLHTKGVLILSSFLAARYSQNAPLSVEASLVFEQSYGEIDGDSASSTELYVIMSALSGVPIKQSLAVTGSVNQFGQIQAIGGVNEKIEGFFDICRLRGLTGDQGVLIPRSNIDNLMLRNDVVEACRAGMFNIYPVETIDEGIEILTGMPAGKVGKNGSYPENTVNGKVQKRLNEFLAQNLEYQRQCNAPPSKKM